MYLANYKVTICKYAALHFVHLNKLVYLQEAGNGGYLCGNFSMADVVMFPVLAFHVRMGLELGERRSHLQAYYNLVIIF